MGMMVIFFNGAGPLEEDVKNYMILYVFIAQGQGQITLGQNCCN